MILEGLLWAMTVGQKRRNVKRRVYYLCLIEEKIVVLLMKNILTRKPKYEKLFHLCFKDIYALKWSMGQQYKKDALIIFCLLSFVYGYFYQDSGWNGNSRFGLIFAIVREGRLTIDTFHNQEGTVTGDKSFFNGHYYSDKVIGPAIVGAVLYAPLYWIKRNFNLISQPAAKIILTFLVIGLPSAIAGSLIYILCLYLSKRRLHAYVITLAIALGTLFFPYSIIFFSHQFSSSLLFIAFCMIFFLKEKPELWQDWYLFVIGLLTGWALISEIPTAIIIFALAIYYISIVWRSHTYPRFRSFILPILGGSIPVVLQLFYNKVCFGNFFSTGYTYVNSPIFNSAMSQGLMGIHWPDLRVLFYMTLHPTMGIFWQSPVLLFSITGAVVMFIEHRYRSEAILVVWIIVSYLVIMSGYYMWWGGRALGPRHIIPILPYFCVLFAFVPKRLTWPLVIFCLISIGQMFIGAANTVLVPEKMIEKINTLGFFEYSNLYSYGLKELIAGHFTQNLGQRIFGLKNWNSLIPVLGVVVWVTIYFVKEQNRDIPSM